MRKKTKLQEIENVVIGVEVMGVYIVNDYRMP